MTVSECLKNWLSGFETLDIREMATDLIQGENDSYAIYKSPNKTSIKYNDGSSLETEYYQFFAKKSSQEDTDRIANQNVLSELEDWVTEKDYEEDYPDLSGVGNLTCTEVGINSSTTITSEEEINAVYQITFVIQYLKER